MTITIDCRLIEASGIGVYLRECLPFFLASPHSFLLIGESEKLRPLTAPYAGPQGKLRGTLRIVDWKAKTFSLRELFFPSPSLLKAINKTDLYYSPYFNFPGFISIPLYTTIHDIVFPDMPELTSKAGLFIRMWFYKRAARHSKKIFTVSNFSKSRIEHHLGAKTPVIVTHSALQPYLQKPLRKDIKKTDTIVFIGNIKKHKGLRCLLEAFFQARRDGLPYKLIIVGEKNNFRSSDSEIFKKLEEAGPAEIEFTGFIGDEKLKELLAGAALLVQPSLYEGFGLPPLEAMTLGTRALISDIPVFREIYGDFPVTFFKAGDVEDLKEKIKKLLLGKKAETIALPHDLLHRYTFEKTSSVILKGLCN
jgi:glycosyltransferase involved in cell wall biosynthesis